VQLARGDYDHGYPEEDRCQEDRCQEVHEVHEVFAPYGKCDQEDGSEEDNCQEVSGVSGLD